MGASVKTNARRAATGQIIPQEVQSVFRERLRMIRLSRRKPLAESEFPAPSTWTNFERHDISTMQVRHLWFMAKYLGLSFFDLISALFGEEGVDSLMEHRTENAYKMLRLFDALNEDDQEIAIRQLDALFVGREARISLAMGGVPLDSDRPRLKYVGAS